MIKYDCRHYRGSKPCSFNKVDGSECPSCQHFSEYRDRILFIKLDAIGDVLRSASLLPVIKARHSLPYIAWLTREASAELVGMMKHVDEVITVTEDGLARIMAGGWHQVYSLSNDVTSASLAILAARNSLPIGFYVRNGVVTPTNDAAKHWLEMAAFDRLKRMNDVSYQELMLRIIGCPDQLIPAPELQVDEILRESAAVRLRGLFGRYDRRRIAINIGAGGRWPKKMLDAYQISRYITLLRGQADVDVVLVGGSAEQKKANTILSLCGSDEAVRAALTETSLAEFVAILSQVDVLVCGDTLALHVATALSLPTIAVFGPTSSSEIFDYDGLVKKFSVRTLDCLGCYGDCAKRDNCMSLLNLEELVGATLARLERLT